MDIKVILHLFYIHVTIEISPFFSALYTTGKIRHNNRCCMGYSCTVCDYKTYKPSNIKRHVRLHTGELPFQCPVCYRRFNEKGNLKKHLAVHKMDLDVCDLIVTTE